MRLLPVPASRTLAISSLFLSSPSTIITFPSPSTSVHRSRGSKAAFAVRILRWKMDPDSSSSRTLRSPSFRGSRSFLLGPKIHSCHVNLSHLSSSLSLGLCSEEAYRDAPPVGVSSRVLVIAAVRCFVGVLGRIESRLRKAARTVGSRLVIGALRGFSVLVQLQTWRRRGRRAVHSAKARPLVCARRNLRSLRDGTAGFNAGGIAGGRGWSVRYWIEVATLGLVLEEIKREN
jgi:hypothetical protein